MLIVIICVEKASQMFRTLEEFPKPVIALINGSCYGGGNGIAMACDIRIAAKPDITFTLSEVKIGFSPAIISRYVSFLIFCFLTSMLTMSLSRQFQRYIVREWGVAKSREAMLTARPIPAQELLDVSAIQYITKDLASAHEKVDEVVSQLVLGAPNAQTDAKKLIQSAATESSESHWGLIENTFVNMMRPCEEGKYGLECFQAKKKPDWSILDGRP
jgi:hydroxymethylglutaryl-CoA lyase